MSEECIFCSIVRGDAPSHQVYADDAVVAILDIFPWATGHTLVIPRRHAATIFELEQEDAVAVIRAAHRLAPALRRAVEAEGLNLLQSNGRAAWQTVDHFHLHMIPRWADDRMVPPGTPTQGDPAAIARTAEAIASELG